MTTQRSLSRKPEGAVLAVGLMLLLVVSMTAVLAMSGSVLQERMTGAVRNESIADNGSESALRDGERWIWQYFVNTGRELRPGGSTYVRSPEVIDAAVKEFRTSQDWVEFGRPYDGNDSASSNAISSNDYHSMPQVPRFSIEVLGEGFAGEVDWAPETHREGGAVAGTGGSPGKLHYYRISARSTGGTAGVIRAAESTYTATY